MMKKISMMRCMEVFLVVVLLFISLGQFAMADVSPGEVIDKSNWEKAQGFLPEQILEWVKKGYLIMNIGALKYNMKDAFAPSVYETFTTNVGKYDVDKHGELIDQKTGKYPYDIYGIPFPVIDEKDPNAGFKIAHNMRTGRSSGGHLYAEIDHCWVSPRGFERKINFSYITYQYTGNPTAKGIPNPDHFERTNIFKVTAPFDLAGTAIMAWNYQGPVEDANFAYVPAIRRVRRTSPASRSDALFGSDFCIDDGDLFEGKISTMNWKLIGKTIGIFAHRSEAPLRWIRYPDGGYGFPKDFKNYLKYGWEVPGWKGAPWAPANAVWVKRPVYIVEAYAKDPYYNYGRQIFWFDAESFQPLYKIIYDRAGKYWKGGLMVYITYDTGQKVGDFDKFNDPSGGEVFFDERTNHATVQHCHMGAWVHRADKYVNKNDFTLAGFQKFCK